MANPFWNPEQRRVRSLWRLLLQGLSFVVLQLILGMVLGLAGMLWVILQPEGAARLQNDPAAIARLITSLITSSPCSCSSAWRSPWARCS